MPDDSAPRDYALDAEKVHEIFSLWDKEVPTVDGLREWFTDDLVFEDPLQRTEGLQEYWEMNERLLKRNHELEIRMEEHAQNGAHIMFTFSLSLVPSAKRPNMRMENTGMTYVRLNDDSKIEYHRDYWDFNSMFLTAFPDRLLRGYKRLVRKLG